MTQEFFSFQQRTSKSEQDRKVHVLTFPGDHCCGDMTPNKNVFIKKRRFHPHSTYIIFNLSFLHKKQAIETVDLFRDC